MQEYSLMSPRGMPDTLRVQVGGRITLARLEATIGYLDHDAARKLAHDLLNALEPGQVDRSAEATGHTPR